MNIKFEIIKLLTEVKEGKYSNVALNKYLKKSAFSDKEKAFFTEVFYGTLRNKILLEYVIKKYTKEIKKEWVFQNLSIAIYQGFFMSSDIKGIVWEATENTKKRYGIAMSKFVNGVLRNVFREKENTMKELEEKDRYDIIYSYPEFIYKKIKNQFGENYIEVLKSYKKVPNLSVRINKLKYNEKDFELYLEKNQIKIIKKFESVYYLSNGKILSSDIFKEGKVIVQDGASYLAAKLLGALKGEKVLDTCAAPGGKSFVIAEMMENEGLIVALDIYEHKLKLIKENYKILGIDIIETKICDSTKLSEVYKEASFDKIITDVPCSGIGVIRKKPETLYGKTKESIKELQKIQRKILEEASKVIKINGEIIYSTCSILREENGDNIADFLEKNTNFEVVKITPPENIMFSYDEFGGVEINYKEEDLDGFYIIKLKRVI